MFGVQDELELRHRNGLNDSEARATIEDAANGMDGFLRAGAANEVTYADVETSMKDYFLYEHRHQMTVLSGAAIFRPTLDGETGTGVQDKIDLNVADADELASEIEAVCIEGAAGMTPPPSITSQAGWTQADFARQFAACIKDYIDKDSQLTLVGPAGGERYGMEALPFVSEIYIQARWVITSSVLVTPPDVWRITWGQEGETGFVIEIRNPFRRRIWLKNIHLWVDGTDWGPLYDPDDATERLTDIDAPLGPGEVLLLYNHSHNGKGDDGVTALIATEAGYTNRSVDIRNKLAAKGLSWPGAAGGGNPKVELRATDQAGNALPWGYCVVPTHAVDTEPVTEDVTSVTNPQVVNPVLYRQYWTVGNGNRLNAMLVKPGDFGQAWYAGIAWALVGRPREAGLDGLGEHDKTGLQAVYDPPYKDPPDDLVDADRNQVLIADREKLTQVGELGQIAIFGPRQPAVLGGDPVTVAEAWAGVTDAWDQMLNFAASDLVGPSGYPNLAVPHAVLLLERFTTLSPLVDGLDNDNADSDEDGQAADDVYEQLVPGTINLNTAPRELLEMVLPIPDSTVRASVVDAITGFRDMSIAPYNDGKRGTNITGYRDKPGIAMRGELMLCLRDILGSDGGDNSTLGATVIDFNWDPTTSTEAADTDGIIDDREEQAMVAKWLSQVASTRSDIFTAYVVILGYPASDFRKGAVESARFIAVFDRSGLTGPEDAVRVVGVQRLD
jgi:hypothetical protein